MPVTELNVPEIAEAFRIVNVVPSGGTYPDAVATVRFPPRVAAPVRLSWPKSVPGEVDPLIGIRRTPPAAWVYVSVPVIGPATVPLG